MIAISKFVPVDIGDVVAAVVELKTVDVVAVSASVVVFPVVVGAAVEIVSVSMQGQVARLSE